MCTLFSSMKINYKYENVHGICLYWGGGEEGVRRGGVGGGGGDKY